MSRLRPSASAGDQLSLTIWNKIIWDNLQTQPLPFCFYFKLVVDPCAAALVPDSLRQACNPPAD